MDLLRNIDLLVLVLALPVFIALDAPITGYIAAGGAWLVGRTLKLVAERRRERAFAAGDRNTALGVTAASMLGRLWIVAAAILVVGLVDEREAGLAAALLAAALVTASLIAETVAHMLSGTDTGAGA